jgi:aryl-alcohol dehydrogenase-like predicted oxidoreductase
MNVEEKRVPLGKSAIEVVPLALGTWTWDSAGQYKKDRDYAEDDLRASFRTSLQHGINFYDTAEFYGNGEVETLLGKFIRESGKRVVVASKFPPARNRFLKMHLLTSLRNGLRRMQLDQFDLYQTHFHFRFVPIRIWMSALADAVGQGLTKAVGTANYSAQQLRIAHSVLARRGIPLASTQSEYSLLHRNPETNGVFATCKELDITLLAYSPLAMGLLSGKFSPSNPPPGARGQRFDAAYLEKIQPLIQLLRSIGTMNGNKTPAQVALNWVMCKGAIPIHGAKNATQAGDNAGALGWRLTGEEVSQLDEISNGVQR